MKLWDKREPVQRDIQAMVAERDIMALIAALDDPANQVIDSAGSVQVSPTLAGAIVGLGPWVEPYIEESSTALSLQAQDKLLAFDSNSANLLLRARRLRLYVLGLLNTPGGAKALLDAFVDAIAIINTPSPLAREAEQIGQTARAGLIQQGDNGVLVIRRLIGYAPPHVRFDLVSVLGEIGTPQARLTLRALLTDPDPQVQQRASQALNP